MKTLIFSVLALTLTAFTVNAQDISKNALGLRLGDNDGLGAEISYQRHLNDNNRLEFDLGWRDSDNLDVFKLVGLYQWVMPIDDSFNWYVGAGAGFGSYDNGNNDGTFALVAGDIGIEYNFDIPLQLSLDFRPELGFDDDYSDDVDFDIALGIRYRF
ncbi:MULTISPECIES: outer membrane beta-barrel protein [Olleya]|uniref:outer membrane beta-barrel protein n=1 Tax=Olleya TaxID=336276 RepID=UPI000C330A74|nr:MULTISPECIES: outer membrane beta-barrel protein [Olleya]PKG50757.1 hypothetical protein CXF54_11410 [Olleya sp. 1-3]